jgi:hypothetical protein
MRGGKRVYIRAGGRGTGRKSLRACIGHGLGWRRVPTGRGVDAVGDNW